MPADKYRFVSPGVFMTEVDQSIVPNLGNNIRGPVVIGRSAQGPAFKPTTVRSYDEFVQIFGDTVPGGAGTDVWRNGNFSTPMYATFAAKAYLANNNPLTFVRLLGAETDDAGTTKAEGAAGWSPGTLSAAGKGVGAYGLFIMPSASAETAVTGTLAAVFYCSGAVPILSGTVRGAAALAGTEANGTLIRSVAESTTPMFKVAITGAADNVEIKAFDFVPNSSNYIRAVFNTDPSKTNSNTTSTNTLAKYWLGETYEKAVSALSSSSHYFGMITGLASGSAGTVDGADFLGLSTTDNGPQASATGWFISQDTNLPSADFDAAINPAKLFKCHGINADGEQTQREVKISIRDLRTPSAAERAVNPYPSFTVEVRHLRDTDLRPMVLETFTNCNLNPNSADYIKRKIGDRYVQYDSTSQRLIEHGDYSNKSKYIRVEVVSDMDANSLNAELMPFGVLGPLTYRSWEIRSGSTAGEATGLSLEGGDGFFHHEGWGTNAEIQGGTYAAQIKLSASMTYPSLSLIGLSNEMGFSDPRDAYFGVNLLTQGSNTRFDESTYDLTRVKPSTLDSWTPGTTDARVQKFQYVFTLDDIELSGAYSGNITTPAVYLYNSGSRASGQSVTANSGSSFLVNTAKISKFTTVMHGGFDGLDIQDRDPFRNSVLDGGTAAVGRLTSDDTNYARASVNRALNIIADPEVVEFNLASVPGVTVPAFTDRLVDVCEERADALAVIDIENDYVPIHEGDPDGSFPALPDVAQAVASMRERNTNSSYGCAFFPWVQTSDSNTGQLLWIPPSVAALGTMGSSAATSELWFAPAGFNRGGLSKGAAGIAVTNVRRKLTSRERDDLYDVRVNPIASFPSEGIVVFGQKTLQLQKSALDRINVRRLMIYIKKRISQIANLILFDQNVPATWARFVGLADPVLKDVQAKFGLEDYRLILDESTTTPELRDRNVMYAKVFLKPAKAIEFIAIDFFITSSGASFED